MYKYENPVLYIKDEYLSDMPVFLNFNNVDFFEGVTFHAHEYIEISYVYEGEGFHQLRDEVQECKKGDVFIIDQNVPHCFFITHEQEKPHMAVKNLLFVPEFIYNEDYDNHDIIDIYRQFMSDVFSCDNAAIKTSLNYEQREFYENIYNQIKYETENKDKGFLTMMNAQINVLLIQLMRFLEHNASNNITYHFSNKNIIENMMEYINEHYSDNSLSIESIAKSLYTSKSYLSRLFKSTMGEYFSDYMRTLRLNESCRLLRETDFTNEQIIEMCGFRDVSTFL